MARKATKRTKKERPADGMLRALKFVGANLKKSGELQQTHAVIHKGIISACDGGMVVGMPVAEQFSACPHAKLLQAALNKCGDTLSLVVADNGTLEVISDKFSASVPCCEMVKLPTMMPDPRSGELSDSVKEGFAAVLPIINENSPTAFTAGVLLRKNTLVGTNTLVIVEWWHGFDLPMDFLVPKSAVVAVVKAQAKLTGFGFSQSSVTFWFEDDSYIKTQLFESRYPNFAKLLDRTLEMTDVSEEFVTAVDSVQGFSDTTLLYLMDGEVRSHYNGKLGAKYQCEGLPTNMAYSAENLRFVLTLATKIALPPNDHALFYGKSLRGALAKGNV